MRWRTALILAGVLLLAAQLRTAPATPRLIDGPYAHLLAASADLGPSHRDRITLTAALHGTGPPVALSEWARSQELSLRWRPGDSWAVLEGPAPRLADAFDVGVREYRGRRGQEFYASPQQPSVPAPLRGAVAELGRIMSYTPHHMSRPGPLPLDVPLTGLTPQGLLRTYNAHRLAADGYTGKGTTIVIFAFDGYDQADLDMFADRFVLPRFTPVLIGGRPSEPRGETTMDLQVAHAVAPDARKVVINARPTVEGDGAYRKIGQLFEEADRRFPGAVWSLSIGWGCDKLLTAADLAPVRSALVAAQANGTTAFNASGDLAGLECRGGDDWSAPPGPDDIGLDSVASLPEMTSVGGTTLSTAPDGGWMSEQAWFDVPLSQGTGGGISALFDRPPWQRAVSATTDVNRRLTPDIAAVADPFTGVQIIYKQTPVLGGGTSQSAPIWAGLAAMMNEYLQAHGGRPLGFINPLLYRIAAGAPWPAFRDVSLGGNAVDTAGPGYDMATGLGTPNVENLVRNVLRYQRVTR